MNKTLFSLALGAATFIGVSASAATFTKSTGFLGDLCATDANASGGFDDCSTIAGNTGTNGVHRFILSGLDLNPLSDVTLRLQSTSADLFNTNGTDNSAERFRLIIGGQNFGRLFDGNSADETAVNAQLGASVQQNIANNIARSVANRSAGPIDLSFGIAVTDFLGLTSGNSLAIDLDFRQDLNINQFSDITISASYTVADPNVVPLPASALLLLGGLGGLAGLRRLKKG